MQLQAINSSKIEAVGYDNNGMILRLKFKYITCDYYEVPSQVYRNLMAASSKSGYFTKHIKNSYRYCIV
ncbi:KTSC domain-containing protein [Cytobacillus sp. IB215665]|uniref:KTSC domain-containing protein n=1 Tax=Cytobacillus sp. IB215665 TaxID=3097357 RepID=UPI002A155158|nr:KTSC domain-containing protein [Cytobacillus sp. IB215665]MDX8366969.1 KTSC domain-containing protein [Cytobacillus sp. IB215665]